MRTLPTGFLACAVSALTLASVIAQPPAPPVREGQAVQVRPPDALDLAQIMEPHVPSSQEIDKETAGLSPDNHPELLTWERVYALALVRARGGREPHAETLDPKALEEQAAGKGVADFSRFRKEFLTLGRSNGEGFRDPSRDYLDLLRRLQMIDDGRRNVAFYENMLKLMQELVQGQAGSVSQIHVDMMTASVVQARQTLSDEIADFRDQLEELKVALGLSPHAPVILDRESMAAFSRVTEQVQSWQRRSDRQLPELPRIIKELPALGDVTVEGRSILAPMEGSPAQQAEVLTRAARLAIKNRGAADNDQASADAAATLELNVRRRIRRLFEIRRAYEGHQRRYDLAIRGLDQAFEQVVAPSAAMVSSRSTALATLLGPENQRLQAEDRLVTLWSSFQTERLGLYRDLGILPYEDWKSFFKDLSAR